MKSQDGGQPDLPPAAAQAHPATVRRHRRIAAVGLTASLGLIAFAIRAIARLRRPIVSVWRRIGRIDACDLQGA
jgi:hypothetical protein